MTHFTREEMLNLHLRRERQNAMTFASQRRHEILFEKYGISPTEFRILAYLFFNPNGAEPSVISESLKLLRQTMTKVVDSLEKKKLAVRATHPYDRRKVFVRPTAEGLLLAETLLDIETDYNLRVNSHFTDEEMHQYRELFTRMQDVRELEFRSILEERKKEE